MARRVPGVAARNSLADHFPETPPGVTVKVVVTVTDPAVAVMVTTVDALTAKWVTLNVADFAPAATVTVAGTVAALVLELDRFTTNPPVAAAPLIFTVPVTGNVVLPFMVVGETETDTSEGGLIVIGACAELVLYVAVTVAVVGVLTAFVVTVNLPVVAPSATLTLAGTVADFELLASFTTIAPLLAPGSAFNVTKPLALVPPATVAGVIESAVTVNGFTVRTAVCVLVPTVAVMVTVVDAFTRR